jgi:hypothetical protein
MLLRPSDLNTRPGEITEVPSQRRGAACCDVGCGGNG